MSMVKRLLSRGKASKECSVAVTEQRKAELLLEHGSEWVRCWEEKNHRLYMSRRQVKRYNKPENYGSKKFISMGW